MKETMDNLHQIFKITKNSKRNKNVQTVNYDQTSVFHDKECVTEHVLNHFIIVYSFDYAHFVASMREQRACTCMHLSVKQSGKKQKDVQPDDHYH